MKKSNSLRKTVLAALFGAIICLMTMLVKIPIPVGGYVHLGDAFILLCSWVLGAGYGAAAAGIGSALADLFSGYPQYAAFTLVIKAMMAWAAATCYRGLGKKSSVSLPGKVVGGLAAELIMALGYFLCDLFFYGAAAMVNLLLYLLKGAVNIGVAVVLSQGLEKTKLLGNKTV